MAGPDWSKHYRLSKLSYYLMIIVSPIIILMVLLILYMGPNWTDYYWFLLILIPVDIIGGILIFRPRVLRARRHLIKSFGEAQVESARGKVENVLKMMKSQYSMSKEDVKAVATQVYYKYVYTIPGKSVEIGIQKSPINNQTYIWVKYVQDSDEEYSNQLCSNIDKEFKLI